MSPAENAWPAIIARHPGLAESLTEDRAKQREEFPPAVLCGFLARLERRYPGMTVSISRPVTDRFADRGESVVIAFRWTAEAILAAGLLSSDQLPQGSRRLCCSESPFARAEPILNRWDETAVQISVRRRAGGLLEVSMPVPPNVPDDHSLAFFRSSSVRGEGRPRPMLRLATVNGARCAEPDAPAPASPGRRSVVLAPAWPFSFPRSLWDQLTEEEKDSAGRTLEMLIRGIVLRRREE